MEEGSEEAESRCGPHKKATEAKSPPAEESDLESSTDGEFDDIIRSLIDEGVVLPTVQTSKRKSCTKPKNVAPSSPPKNMPHKNMKWLNWLTKGPTGTFESVEIDELEKHYIARVQSISADEDWYQDVLIPSDKILPKLLKIEPQILKIVSADDANEQQRDGMKTILTSLLCFEFFVNDFQLKYIINLYWNSFTLQERDDCYNELRSWNMRKSILIKVSICICLRFDRHDH